MRIKATRKGRTFKFSYYKGFRKINEQFVDIDLMPTFLKSNGLAIHQDSLLHSDDLQKSLQILKDIL